MTLTPFECEPYGYQIAGMPNSLQKINIVTGVEETIKENLGFTGNALGYNPKDNFLYAINNKSKLPEVIRIVDWLQ